MRNVFNCTFLAVANLFLFLITSCAPSNQNAKNKEFESKLMLRDLKPYYQIELPAAKVIQVFLYQLPLEEIPGISSTLDFLDTDSIQYSNKSVFQKNQLWAAKGRNQQGAELVKGLASLEALRIKTRELLLYGDYREEFASIDIYDGQLKWMIRASNKSHSSKVANLQIHPMYIAAFSEDLYRMSGLSQQARRVYGDLGFQVDLEEGEFLVLAAQDIDFDSTTPNSLFLQIGSRDTYGLLYVILCRRIDVEKE